MRSPEFVHLKSNPITSCNYNPYLAQPFISILVTSYNSVLKDLKALDMKIVELF